MASNSIPLRSWSSSICVVLLCLPQIYVGYLVVQSDPSYPDIQRSCGVSAIQQESSWTLAEMQSKFPNCSSFFFYLSHGRYHSLPGGYFSKLGQLKHFFFELTNLSFAYFPSSPEATSPFQDVFFEVSLVMQLVEVTSANPWNWNHFRYPKPKRGGTTQFECYQCKIDHLDGNFSNIFDGSVTTVRFSGGTLKTMDDFVFSGFSSLKEVYLHDNQISQLRRNYFPNPAMGLETLILAGNKLQSLPKDLFLGMPSLVLVSVTRNPLVVLDESTFRDVFGRISLHLAGTGFQCDCSIRWVKYLSGPDAERSLKQINCSTPVELRGQMLVDVDENELKC